MNFVGHLYNARNHLTLPSAGIPQYELTTEDGTTYEITRQFEGAQATYAYYRGATASPTTTYVTPRSGKLKVTKIKRPSGESITVVTDINGEHIDFILAGQSGAQDVSAVGRQRKDH
jgi:hypothetical protein